MKVIFRCDDVGYTHVHNLGTIDTIEKGVSTHCDCMFDWPDVIEMLEYLKDKPWISVGWHPHMWGRPVLDPKEVPSLVNENGDFKWKRIDLKEHPVEGVDFDEMVKEFTAQMELCKKHLGRYPDVLYGQLNGEKKDALIKTCENLNIPYGIMNNERHGVTTIAEEKWRDKNIWGTMETNPRDDLVTLPGHKSTLNVLNFLKYDPEEAILTMPIDDSKIMVKILHPGYLDVTVLEEQTCNIHRVRDAQVLMSDKVKQWIIDNKIELINTNDALYGTNTFQDHLKEVNSPLWIGNMK